jgi:hypothetical protein
LNGIGPGRRRAVPGAAGLIILKVVKWYKENEEFSRRAMGWLKRGLPTRK